MLSTYEKSGIFSKPANYNRFFLVKFVKKAYRRTSVNEHSLANKVTINIIE